MVFLQRMKHPNQIIAETLGICLDESQLIPVHYWLCIKLSGQIDTAEGDIQTCWCSGVVRHKPGITDVPAEASQNNLCFSFMWDFRLEVRPNALPQGLETTLHLSWGRERSGWGRFCWRVGLWPRSSQWQACLPSHDVVKQVSVGERLVASV